MSRIKPTKNNFSVKLLIGQKGPLRGQTIFFIVATATASTSHSYYYYPMADGYQCYESRVLADNTRETLSWHNILE